MATVVVNIKGKDKPVIFKNIPDDATPEQFMEFALGKLEGAEIIGIKREGVASKKKPTFLSEAAAVGQETLRNGIAGIPKMFMDAITWPARQWIETPVREGLPSIAEAYGLPTKSPSGYIDDTISAVIGAPKHPQTRVGEFTSDVGTGLAAAFASPGGALKPAQTAIMGLGSGVGAGTAGQLVHNNPIAEVIGALLGGGVSLPAVMKMKKKLASPQVMGIVKQMKQSLVGDAEDDGRKAAEEFADIIQNANARRNVVSNDYGIDSTLPQMLSQSSDADVIAAELAKSNKAPITKQILKTQPTQISIAGSMERGKLPGKTMGMQKTANLMQDASTDYFKWVRGLARKAWQKYAPEELELPEDALDELRKGLKKLADKYKNLPERDAILAARANLMDKEAELPTFITNAVRNREAFEHGLNSYESSLLNTKTVNRKTMARLMEARNLYTDILGEYVPQLKKANKAYSDIMKNVYNPAKKGPIGRLAGITGSIAEKEASTKGKLIALFREGTNPEVGGVSEILTTAAKLKKINPSAFPSAVKSYISDIYADVGKDQHLAQEIIKKLYLKPKQQQGFRDMLAGVARSYDLPENEVVRSATRFMDVVRDIARPGLKGKGLSSSEFRQLAGESLFSSYLRMMGLRGMVGRGHMAMKAEQKTLEKTFKHLDELFTTDEGAKTLIEIANAPKDLTAHEAILKGFLATLAQRKED